MRGGTSSDGKLSGNRQLVDAYDRDKGHGKPARHQEPKNTGGDSGGVHDPEGHDEIKQVAEEHGHAHKHVITKKEGGGYQSETHHEDGHVAHHDHHDTIEHAHAHGAYAMGDSDHVPADEEARDQMHGRSMNERESSGSGSSGVDFLPGENG
jgi:hypothetical protein